MPSFLEPEVNSSIIHRSIELCSVHFFSFQEQDFLYLDCRIVEVFLFIEVAVYLVYEKEGLWGELNWLVGGHI